MIDVRKFIAFFIALAIFAGTAAFILPQFGTNNAPISPGAAPFTIGGGTSSPYADSFVEPTSTEAAQTLASAFDTAAADPNNLTGRLVETYTSAVAAYNPNGPQTDANGNQTLEVPTEQSVLSDFASSSAYRNMTIPNWNADPALSSIHISTDTNATATVAYVDALNNISQKYFVADGLQGVVSDPSSATQGSVSLVSSELNGALGGASALSVPENLANLQESFMKVLVYDRNAVALTENASADPLKSSIIFQGESARYMAAIQELASAWQSAMANRPFSLALANSGSESRVTGFINALIGIPTAHAQWTVFDPALFGKTLWEWAQSILLQVLKDELISRVQYGIMKLVQNSGDPLFIQNWGGFLDTAFNVAAGSAIGQIDPGLCGNFRTDVGGWLKNAFSSANISLGGVNLNGAAGADCTLGTVSSGITKKQLGLYYNHFNQGGGLEGFGELLSPNNNLYGAIVQSYNQVTQIAAANQQNVKNQAEASGGFKGQATCPNASGTKAVKTTASTCPNGSSPTVETLGSTIKNVFHNKLNSITELTANATQITGLISSLTEDILNKTLLKGLGIAEAAPIGLPLKVTAPVQLSCNANPSVASTSQSVVFVAENGDMSPTSTWSWSVSGGTDPSQPNMTFGTSSAFSSFMTAFSQPGIWVATVNNDSVTASCPVTIHS